MDQGNGTGSGMNRRSALKAVGAAGAVALVGGRASVAGAADRDDAPKKGAHGGDEGIEPKAGTWRTWVLSSATEIPVAPPPSGKAAQEELDAVRRAVADRSEATRNAVSFWDAGAPGFRWNQIGTRLVIDNPVPDSFRMSAYLNLAIYDATIATWAAKQAYRRARPADKGKPLPGALSVPDSPSYPSEHGAAAGAAVGVLSHLFPDKAAELAARAKEHAAARVAAGVEFPSDFDAGFELGAKVAAKVTARSDADGFGAPYPGVPDQPYPGGDGSYPVLPVDEGFLIMIGRWKPLVLGDVTAFRPPPPPARDSAQRAAELAEVKSYPRRKQADFSELFFWATDPAGRPEPNSVEFFNAAQAAFYYAVDVQIMVLEELNQKIHEYRLDANPPRAARAYALTYATLLDAYIACWNAKYHYLVGRPIHFDPTVDTLWTTYLLASYPSGHSTNMMATATMLGYLFPRDAQYFASRAAENAASRFWAGIHFTSDSAAGVAMGRAIGQAIIDHARKDGS